MVAGRANKRTLSHCSCCEAADFVMQGIATPDTSATSNDQYAWGNIRWDKIDYLIGIGLVPW